MALVLSRKPGETILIGDNIKVTVTQTGRNAAKLAIEAPREVTVLRSEIVAEIEPELVPA